jgi:exonuclease SbcD
LGRKFHGELLMREQEAAVDRLVDLAFDAEVDLVVIAGDLYDRAIPPADAVGLFDDALVRLHGTGARIVAIAGNHDSANRVAVGDRILEQAGVTVRGDVSRCFEPLRFDPGDGGPPVAVYPVPFLEPSLAGPALSRLDGSADAEGSRRFGHREVTDQAMALIRCHAASGGPARTVVVAHTFVSGGTITDSERDLSVGNIDVVDMSAFDGFDYVALGHLHRSQDFDGGRVAYSGTPLAYSFSEERDTKSARIVELDAEGHCRSEVVPLGVGRPLRTLRGRLDDLLGDPGFAVAEQARVRVHLTDPELPLQAMPRLRTRFPHAVALEHDPEGRVAPGRGAVADAAQSAETTLDLAMRFWADQHGADPSKAQADVIEKALTAVEARNQG